jgi:hypothetical protein
MMPRVDQNSGQQEPRQDEKEIYSEPAGAPREFKQDRWRILRWGDRNVNPNHKQDRDASQSVEAWQALIHNEKLTSWQPRPSEVVVEIGLIYGELWPAHDSRVEAKWYAN